MSWKKAMDSSFPVVSIIPGGEGSAPAGQQVRMLTASYIDGFLRWLALMACEIKDKQVRYDIMPWTTGARSDGRSYTGGSTQTQTWESKFPCLD